MLRKVRAVPAAAVGCLVLGWGLVWAVAAGRCGVGGCVLVQATFVSIRYAPGSNVAWLTRLRSPVVQR